jgi:RNA polymerase sigma-70 factor (ECF subfamily)
MAQDSSDSTPPPDSRRTSRSLLQRARAHEPDAWLRLCALYEPMIRYWCRRGGVATQDIDDVVQEVFAKAFAALDSFRHRSPSDTFRGWLHGVTRHRVLEHYRRIRRHLPAAGGSDAQQVLLSQPDPGPGQDEEENQLCGEMYRRAVAFIRDEFEPRTWQMFCRSVVDGVATAAVAAELGASTAAVRQARYRVLRRIREETAELTPWTCENVNLSAAVEKKNQSE